MIKNEGKSVNEKNRKDVTESLSVNILLAIVGGYLAAYTYIARGGVFANAQTGNLIKFSMSLAMGNFIEVFFYLIPIFSFIFGIFATNIIQNKFHKYVAIHWKQVVIIIHIVILFIVGFIQDGDKNVIANALVSLVCAMQLEAFRLLNGNSITTVICTGNMRSGTSQLYEYIRTKNKKSLYNGLQYYVIILSFCIGVMVGTWITNIFWVRAIFLTCILLIIVFILLFINENSLKENKRKEKS